MLAWVHQSIATEREIVMGLFGPASQPPAPRESAPSRAAPSPAPGDAEAKTSSGDAQPDDDNNDEGDDNGCSYMLERIFDGVVRPLKVRIDQVRPAGFGAGCYFVCLFIVLLLHCTR